MFYMYRDRWKECLVSGVEENVVLTSIGNTNSRYSANYIHKALLQPNTIIKNGDLVSVDGNKYLVVSKKKGFNAVQAQFYKTNAVITVKRMVKEYDENDNWTGGYTETTIYENIPTLYQDITGKMQQFDQGLLSTSTRKFITQVLPNMQKLDRIVFNNENMEVSEFNTTEFDGLYSIQCQPEKR